jgi:two-component system, cell cycle sensor histidine kinase and response regulator CckA
VPDGGLDRSGVDLPGAPTISYRAILELASDPILIRDLQGRFVDVNEAAYRNLGYTREEFLALRLEDVAPPDVNPGRDQRIARLTAGETIVEIRRLRRRDGTLIEVENSSQLLPGGLILTIARDLTEWRRREEQLREAQKMEAVGRLAGGIAHDFNNLLAAVQGFAELIGLDAVPGGDTQQMSEEIVRAAGRGKALADRLLTFARQRGEEPVVVDLGELTARASALFGQAADERVTLSLDLALDRLPVLVDPVQLEQALINLVINAHDAIPGTGSIVVSTRFEAVRPGHRAADAGLTPGAYARLSVADTGAGIAPEITPRLFEPFFTTKPLSRGAGLGLSIVYSVVAAAGGRVLVESVPGAGARFDVFLPLAVGETPGAGDAEPPVASAGDASGPLRVSRLLVVDDEPMILTIVERVLTQAGHTVVTASSAEAALEIVDGGFRPTVLVTDVLLPAMSGLGLAAALRDRMPGMPVVFVSGYEGNGVPGETAREAGLFLQKPFRADELVASVLAALAGATAMA